LKALVHPSGFKLFGDILVEGYGEITIDMPTTDTGEQISDVTFLLLFSLYADLFLGEYTAYLEHILWMKVGDISPFTVKALADGDADLSSFKPGLRRARVINQVCKFLNMTDPGTLTFTDVSLIDSLYKTARVSGGSGYSPLTTTASIVSGTGSGALLEAVVSSGAVVAINILNGGSGYELTDTISIIGDGVGASFTFTLHDVPVVKVTRSVGSWITDGLANACSRFTVNNNVMFIYRDLDHVATATDLYVNYTAIASISNVFVSGTYTWSGDLVTVNAASHGLYPGQTVILTFTGGDLSTSHPHVVTVTGTGTFTVPYLGSGTGGNVTIEKAFGYEKIV